MPLLIEDIFSKRNTGMLVLGRRHGETLMIGDDIKITVLAVHGNEVRIGIDAPKDVSVHRQEIYQRIQAQKRSSAPVHFQTNGVDSNGQHASLAEAS